MEKDNTAFLIIGFFIILLIIVSIIFVVNYTREVIDDKTDKNFVNGTFELLAQDNGHNIYDVNYILKRDNMIIQEGILKDGFRTEYNSVLNNTDYILQIITPDYYYRQQTCTIINDRCIVKLSKKANVIYNYLEIQDFHRVIYYLDDGILKDVAICIQENTDKINGIYFDENYFERTNKFESRFDGCYYPINRTRLHELKLEEVKDNWSDIKDYNKEESTDYEQWDDIQFTNNQLEKIEYNLNKPLFEFNIYFEYDSRFKFKKGDMLKIALVDEYQLKDDNDIIEYDVIELFDEN